MAKIGDLCEISGELTIEWKIKDFSSLSTEKNACYHSSSFYFSGSSWELCLFAKGDTENESYDWIGIYLVRKSIGHTVVLNCSIAFKTADGNKKTETDGIFIIGKKGSREGFPKLISRHVLIKRKTELIPFDELTIICTLENNDQDVAAGSLFNRLQDVCDNLLEIYRKGKSTDLLLKLNRGKIKAHRMILETRSPVFAAMFNHDTKEKKTGEISIEDYDKNTLENILAYMYSGDFDGLTIENVLTVYAAADKYNIKDAKEICVPFIIENLSVDWICDVIKFAELYQEKEITLGVREYFRNNAGEILETDKWKTFAQENVLISVDFLSTALKTFYSK